MILVRQLQTTREIFCNFFIDPFEPKLFQFFFDCKVHPARTMFFSCLVVARSVNLMNGYWIPCFLIGNSFQLYCFCWICWILVANSYFQPRSDSAGSDIQRDNIFMPCRCSHKESLSQAPKPKRKQPWKIQPTQKGFWKFPPPAPERWSSVEFPVELGVRNMMKLVNMLVNWIPFVPCYAPWTLKLDQMRRCPPESPEDVFFLEKVEAATTNTSFGTGDGRTSRSW